ncbi:YggS family pyridoxal phosphate-dependent enzyme [Escherichia coli]
MLQPFGVQLQTALHILTQVQGLPSARADVNAVVQRPAELPPLNVLIQINISDENSKSGIQLAELDELAAAVAELPRLRLRGLMAIPAPESEYVRQFEVARQMAVAFAGLKTRYPHIDTLSLGMSDDMEAAIAAGSTMVRIGTAIFGARDYSKKSQ